MKTPTHTFSFRLKQLKLSSLNLRPSRHHEQAAASKLDQNQNQNGNSPSLRGGGPPCACGEGGA